MTDLSRRRFVQGTGAVIAASALAGCGSDGGGGGGGGDEVPQEIADHLSDANGYDDSIDDQTGEDEVTVEVGAGDNALAFDPAAVRVDAGTTVLWEWTGEGGGHNVASTDGSDTEFSSEIFNEAGQHFEQTFDQAGIQLYVCEPHQGQGMKGAVDVVES